jgi:hypothetical protein
LYFFHKKIKNLKNPKNPFLLGSFVWVFLGGILVPTLPAPSRGGSCGAAPGQASAPAVPTGCPVQWGGIGI